MILIIFLLVLGAGLVILEIMFPSFGVLGMLAATSVLFSILKAFEMGDNIGYTMIVMAMLAIPAAIAVGFKFLKHSPLVQRAPKDMTASGVDTSLRDLLGRHGVAQTPLRPAGLVDVEGQRVDAVSDGSFLEAGTPVTLVHVEGNRVVVTSREDDGATVS